MPEFHSITSRSHPLITAIRALKDDRSSNEILLEGPRLVADARHSRIELRRVFVREDFVDGELIDQMASVPERYRVSASVFDALTSVRTPQGLLAVATKPMYSWEDLFARAPLPMLILDGIQDPGNAAALLRTAEAAGVTGVITTPQTAHLFSPKALRGAMGSSLRLPILEHVAIADAAAKLKEAHYALAATSSQPEGIVYTAMDWNIPWAFILGQEGGGLSLEWEPLVTALIKIPMDSPVESLNVSAAAAVILYESRRQRSVGFP